MGEIGGLSSNGIRYTGLATGMDTDAMIKKLMMAENMKVEKVRQNKQYEEWQQEAYIDIIKDLKGVYSDYLDITNSSENNILKSSLYSTAKGMVTDANKDIVSINGLAGAMTGTYKIKVNSLAEGARLQSVDAIGTNKDGSKKLLDGSKKLNEFGISGDINFIVKGENFKLTVDGEKTINEFVEQLKSTKSDSQKKTLSEVLKVNYSSITNKITFETIDKGASASLQIGGTAATTLGISNLQVLGQNADLDITIPGETTSTNIKKESNDFIIDNVVYNLKAADKNREVTVDLKADATETTDKIEKFVNKYNELIKKINTKLEEKKDYKFKPLTEEQRKGMKEDEIKQWEERAKRGILRRDNNLQKMLFDLRRAFTDSVKDVGINFKDVGIDTSKFMADRGKLVLDKDKLKKALEEKGDLVLNLFAKSSDKLISSTSTSQERKEFYEESGIFQRVKNIVNDYVGFEGALVKKAGYEGTRWAVKNDLTESIEKKDRKIKEMEIVLFNKENKYYQKFARLEKAMNSLNAQSNWLYSQLGGGK